MSLVFFLFIFYCISFITVVEIPANSSCACTLCICALLFLLLFVKRFARVAQPTIVHRLNIHTHTHTMQYNLMESIHIKQWLKCVCVFFFSKWNVRKSLPKRVEEYFKVGLQTIEENCERYTILRIALPHFDHFTGK